MLFNMAYLFLNPLDVHFEHFVLSDPHNFFLKIFQKLLKNFQKYFMVHQLMLKVFHGPCKNPLAYPPTYLMYGP